jgi:hypothetical protein
VFAASQRQFMNYPGQVSLGESLQYCNRPIGK